MEIQERPSLDMVIDTVDLLDRPIGKAIRRTVLASAQNFRVAHLFLFNSTGELLIQQLGRNRERHPQAWGSSVAAYLFAEETYNDAIRRRVSQELGREIGVIARIGGTSMQDTDSEKFIGLYSAVDDGPFAIDHNHIEQVVFSSISAIERDLADGARTFTPTFQHLFSFYLRERRSRT